MSAYFPRMLISFAVLALAAPAVAEGATKGDLTLVQPQVRASIGKAPNTAAYFTVRNRGARPDRLLSASCTCAARVEIHTHQSQGGVARMVRVPSVTIPARGEAVLAPGGAHLMLFGLKQPLRDGGRQSMTLVFERAGAVTTTFAVAARIEAPASAHAH